MDSKKFSSLVSSQEKYLYKITGKDAGSGREAWWIVRVWPEKLVIFAGIVMKGNITFTDYGDILESGFGATIPGDVLSRYGF